jgi:hypothetical protein
LAREFVSDFDFALQISLACKFGLGSCWNFRHRRLRLLTSARRRGSMQGTGESGHGIAADPDERSERDRTN